MTLHAPVCHRNLHTHFVLVITFSIYTDKRDVYRNWDPARPCKKENKLQPLILSNMGSKQTFTPKFRRTGPLIVRDPTYYIDYVIVASSFASLLSFCSKIIL